MLCNTRRVLFSCAYCPQRQQDYLPRIALTGKTTRHFQIVSPLRHSHGSNAAQEARNVSNEVEEKELGAMSRRLEEMTERGLEDSGFRADKMVGEAGFSEELKKKLEARIAYTKLRSEHPSAFATLDIPVCIVFTRTIFR